VFFSQAVPSNGVKGSEFHKNSNEGAVVDLSIDPSHILNVSGSNNACGLFALALGTKLALEAQANSTVPKEVQEYLNTLQRQDLEETTEETAEIAKNLRQVLAHALLKNAVYKNSRLESFKALALKILQNEKVPDMEAFEESNLLFLEKLKNDFDALELSEESLKSRLPFLISEANEIKIRKPEIQIMSEKIMHIRNHSEGSSVSKSINEFLSGLGDPNTFRAILRLIKLYRLCVEALPSSGNGENRSELGTQFFNFCNRKLNTLMFASPRALRGKAIYCYASHLKFDKTGKAAKDQSLDFNLFKQLYINFAIQEKEWDTCFVSYCNYLGNEDVFLTVDEIGNLAVEWNINLCVQQPNGQKSYHGRQNTTMVNLVNRFNIHWQVYLNKPCQRLNTINNSNGNQIQTNKNFQRQVEKFILANQPNNFGLEKFLQSFPKKQVENWINNPPEEGEPLLIIATVEAPLEMIELLIEFGAMPNKQDFFGNTAAHCAYLQYHSNNAYSKNNSIDSKHFKILKLLIDKNSSLDILNEESDSVAVYLVRDKEYNFLAELFKKGTLHLFSYVSEKVQYGRIVRVTLLEYLVQELGDDESFMRGIDILIYDLQPKVVRDTIEILYEIIEEERLILEDYIANVGSHSEKVKNKESYIQSFNRVLERLEFKEKMNAEPIQYKNFFEEISQLEDKSKTALKRKPTGELIQEPDKIEWLFLAATTKGVQNFNSSARGSINPPSSFPKKMHLVTRGIEKPLENGNHKARKLSN